MTTRALVTAFDSNYLWPGIVAGGTALAHSPSDVRLYVFGVGLSTGEQNTISDAIEHERLTILDAGHLAQGMPGWRHISNAAWARVGMGTLLPKSVGRVVYVDADTFTRKSLDHLFDVDLDGKVLGACIDRPMPTQWDRHLLALDENSSFTYMSDTAAPATYCYFNSGVLSVDLQAWRERDIEGQVIELAQELPDSFSLLDQDALNSILFDDWKLLDWQLWNWPGYLKDDRAWEAHVAHFVSAPKPWVASPLGAPFNLEYLRTARKLGWDLRPGRVRIRSGLIETLAPNGLVVRRKRIAARLRGQTR